MSDIKEIAKELCDKSGCHHKCHDTTDCVVEDDALLLINQDKSNNFDVKSNEKLFKQALVEGVSRHFDKTIEEAKKIEQIEEMAFILGDACAGVPHKVCETTPCNHCRAEALYNAGYRKQNEWISVEDRLPEKNGEVLVYNGKAVYTKMFMYPNEFTTFKKEPNFCYCDKSGDVWWIKSTDKITHWTPLPEAPKMTRKEDEGK